VLGGEVVLKADVVIIAFGFRASPREWLAGLGVERHDSGLVKVNGARLPHQTSNPKIFAGGDMVRGADLVVTAVADGRDAAREIARMLG
jgi:glutamate synthase (NADPH/NADH) small chain